MATQQPRTHSNAPGAEHAAHAQAAHVQRQSHTRQLAWVFEFCLFENLVFIVEGGGIVVLDALQGDKRKAPTLRSARLCGLEPNSLPPRQTIR